MNLGHQALITNAGATYIYYLPAVFFPENVVLGLGPILSSFSQFMIHGINMNKSLGTWYNPGLATCVILMYPIGIAYIHIQTKAGKLGLREWVYSLISVVAFTYITLVKWTFTWAPDMNSHHPFTHSEMMRPGSLASLRAAYT